MDSKKIKAAAISSEPQEQFHSPVMAKEVVEHLDLPEGGIVVDATMGLGGHSECLLNAYPLISKLIGMDVDQAAISLAKGRLSASAEKMEM